MLEQLSIFDASRLILGDYYLALEKGEWDSLPSIMDMLEQLGVKLDHWKEKYRFWSERIPQLRKAESFSVQEKGKFLEDLQKELLEREWIEESLRVEKYWLRRILKEIDSRNPDYITPNLHVADAFLKLGKYQKALEAAQIYCSQKETDPRLLSLQTYCLYKQNKLGAATTLTVFAMFYNPLQVEPGFFYNPRLLEVLNSLREEYRKEEEARAVWPWVAWQQGVFEIPPGEEYAGKIREIYGKKLLKFKPQDEIQKQLYFNHLLYLCEVERKNHKFVTGEMVELLICMKRTNCKFYQRYLQHLNQ